MMQGYAVHNLNRGVLLAGRIRVAGTSESRRHGLLGIDRLDGGSGIWIAPCEAIHTFGMKMPIDVIFLDRELRVRKLVPVLAPRRLSVSLLAHSVLELEPGSIDRSATRLGDRLRFTPLR
jgi:uncharacterized protein